MHWLWEALKSVARKQESGGDLYLSANWSQLTNMNSKHGLLTTLSL